MKAETEQLTVGDVLHEAAVQLGSRRDAAGLEAQVWLAHVLEKPRTWVRAHPEAALSDQQSISFRIGIKRLSEGEPLPYLLGKWEFFGLSFSLTPEVLIPRPETELLVGTGINWLQAHPDRRTAIDVGTGSGCIAVTLTQSVPDLRVTAVDISPAALHVAQQNARQHRVSARVQFIVSDLFERVPGRFDLVCANLPYIPTGTLHQLDVGHHEPDLALNGGSDGLHCIRAFLSQAPGHVNAEGLVLAEIEAGQGAAAKAIAQEYFPQALVTIHQDLAGHDRMVSIELQGGADQ